MGALAWVGARALGLGLMMLLGEVLGGFSTGLVPAVEARRVLVAALARVLPVLIL